jgi:hypothetical protein
VQSCKSTMCCCSFCITSSICATCCGTYSSLCTLTTVIERSSMLTLSLTSSCLASKCSLLCCSSVFSSSHFAYRERFSFSAALRCSSRSFCTCAKA